MKGIKLCLSLLLMAGVLGYSTVALAQAKPKGVKPGVTSAVALNKAGTYCHMKFPAISKDALGTAAKPTAKDLTGAVIDYYGPCNHDPIGEEEVCKQTADLRRSESCD